MKIMKWGQRQRRAEKEEELEKEIEELRKGDVEVPKGWKEWKSEKSARMGRFVDESEDSETDDGEEEELMRGMGAVAGLSKRVETEGLEEPEEDGDEACWNCRSQNISCIRIR